MPVLDTTVLIDMRRRPAKMEPLLRRVADMPEDAIVPMQVALEFAAGEKDPEAAITTLEEDFLLKPFDDAIARRAASIAAAAIRKGKLPGWGDVQIAATALHEGTVVMTRNPRHLSDALGARVWDYSREPEPPE